MKKKITVLAVLLLAVVTTAYSVSGTYAKYTSSKESSDSARVAKWGINITNDIDLFDASYLSTDDTTTDVANGTDDDKNVVAPGTKGEYTFKLAGAPETNYTLVVDAEGTDDIGRIVYTLDTTTYTTIDALCDAIEDLYDANKVYAANTSSESEHTIGWEWKFAEDGKDETDTGLGNAGTAEVSLKVKITATQTEEAAN